MTKQELVEHFELFKQSIKEYQDANRYSHFNRLLLKVSAQLDQTLNAMGVEKKRKFTSTPPVKFEPPKEAEKKVEEVEDSVILADNSETLEGVKKARKRRKKADDTSND